MVENAPSTDSGRRQLRPRTDLPSGAVARPSAITTSAEPQLSRRAGFRAHGRPQFCRGIEHRRAAHHGRARVIGAVAVADISGRAVEHLVDAIDRHFHGVGGDLREDASRAPGRRERAEIDGERAVGFQHQTRAFLRAGGAALDKAAHREAVIAAVDQLALELLLFGPAEFREAALEASPDNRRCRAGPCCRTARWSRPGRACSASRTRLRRRNSTRSMPRSRAAMSSSRSRKKLVSNRPGPR